MYKDSRDSRHRKSDKDVFVHPSQNRGDKWFIVIEIILTLVFIFSLISSISTKAYGDIYTPIALLSGILLLVALATKGNLLVNEVVFGKIETVGDLAWTIAVGLIVGVVAFGLVYIFGAGLLNIATVLPLAITAGSSVTLSEFFLAGFIGVLAEDGLVQQLLIPTIANMLNNPWVLAIIMFIAGIIFLTAISGTIIIGAAFIIIGFFFLGIHILQVDLSRSDNAKHLIAALFGGMGIGGIYHYYSYSLTSSNPYGAILIAGLFFVVFALENWKLQNTIGGMMSHSTFNMLLLTVVFSAPISYMLVILLVFIAIIYATYKAGRWK
jgi:hypothetical protein